MRTDLFDFELPASPYRIAPREPARFRARMLIVEPDGVLRDRIVADLPQWALVRGPLVVNDTKVIAAQLTGRRIGQRTEPNDRGRRLESSGSTARAGKSLVKPAKKLSQGAVVRFGNEGRVCPGSGISMRRSSTKATAARSRFHFHFTARARSGHRRSRQSAAAAVHRRQARAR